MGIKYRSTNGFRQGNLLELYYTERDSKIGEEEDRVSKLVASPNIQNLNRAFFVFQKIP
jgi:hypothetical protein